MDESPIEAKEGKWSRFKNWIRSRKQWSADKPGTVTLISFGLAGIVVYGLKALEPGGFNWWASIGTFATVAAGLLAVFIWLATASDASDLRADLQSANEKLDSSEARIGSLTEQLSDWIHSDERKSGAIAPQPAQTRAGHTLAQINRSGLRPVSEIPEDHRRELARVAKVDESDLAGGRKPDGPGNFNWHIVAKDGREWTVFYGGRSKTWTVTEIQRVRLGDNIETDAATSLDDPTKKPSDPEA